MSVLVDTHAVVWWLRGVGLGPRAKALLDRREFRFSAVSVWEVELKRRGKDPAMPSGLHRTLHAHGLVELPLSARHAEAAAALPLHHRDPADRFLVAQAQLEGLVLLTADELVRAYDVQVLDPRR